MNKRKEVIAVLRSRRLLEKYARMTDGLISDLALNPCGETYGVAERVLRLIEVKRRLSELSHADSKLRGVMTEGERDALTVCVCGEGSRRASARLGIPRESILAEARRGLDKCAGVIENFRLSEDASALAEMLSRPKTEPEFPILRQFFVT